METIIGISEDRLRDIIYDATLRAYQQGMKDAERVIDDSQWLNSTKEIIHYLSPDRHFTMQTFNKNRRVGKYGDAIIGRGSRCRARKSDLDHALRKWDGIE